MSVPDNVPPYFYKMRKQISNISEIRHTIYHEKQTIYNTINENQTDINKAGQERKLLMAQRGT